MKIWLARYGEWIALFALAAIYYPYFGKGDDMLRLYVDAGACVLGGEPMLGCQRMFPYQPALAALMIPLRFVPAALLKPVWYLICVASLATTVRVSELLADRIYPGVAQGRNLIHLRFASVLLCAKHIADVLNYESYDAPALAVIMLGTWALAAGREALGGFGLAVAAATRATPLIFLPYLVLKRRYLACLAFVGGFAAVSLLPDAVSALEGGRVGYVSDWFHQIAAPAVTSNGTEVNQLWDAWNGHNLNNQSLRGLVNRFTFDAVFGRGAAAIGLAVDAVFASVLALVLLLSPRRKEFVAIDTPMLLIAMLALSPMTSRYHFVFVLPAVVMVVAAIIMDARVRLRCSIVLAASFMLLTGTSNDLSGQWLAEQAYRYGFMLFGAILLLAAFAAMLRALARGRATPARIPTASEPIARDPATSLPAELSRS